MELLGSSSPITSPAQPALLPATAAGSAVRFERVNFHYPSRPLQAALQDFTLSVSPGKPWPGGTQWRRKEHRVSAAAAFL
jgi:ATP-binding cassette subfamily B protein